MHLPHYPIEADELYLRYLFVSSGPNGNVEKSVIFTKWGSSGAYNLGFGDRIPGTDDINDQTVTNNGDMEMVLWTVAAIAGDFLQRRQGAAIILTGSTPSRTRLYRIQIGKHLSWLNNQLMIFGLIENRWEIFNRSRDYEAFYVSRRS